jgi:uncharacterized protein YjdB
MRMLNQWMKLAPVLALTVAASACSDTSPTEVQGLQAGTAPSAALVGSTGVTQVKVYPGSFTLDVGQVKQMIAIPKNAAGTTLSLVNHPLTWSSSNPSAAKVDAAGRVTALGGGTTNIKATYDGVSSTAKIVVRAPIAVASVAITAPTTSAKVGAYVQLVATPKDASGSPVSVPVTWSSSNSAVARVYSNGLVHAASAGKATITVKAGTKSAQVVITVGALTVAPAPAPTAPVSGSGVTSVAVFPLTATLNVGLVKQLIALPRNSSGTTVSGKTPTWKSSNTAVATVSSTGILFTRAAGVVKVTATVDGVVGTSTITVTKP